MLEARDTISEEDVAQPTAKTRGNRPRGTRKQAEDRQARGLRISDLLAGAESPFHDIEWERRQASITDDKGGVVFVQDDVEVPKSWSMLATNVVSSKYFYGAIGTPEREYSVRQLIHRVTRTIADWGINAGYFASDEDAETFCNELAYACVHQYGSFNSPVWFNVGLFQVYGCSSSSRAS